MVTTHAPAPLGEDVLNVLYHDSIPSQDWPLYFRKRRILSPREVGRRTLSPGEEVVKMLIVRHLLLLYKIESGHVKTVCRENHLEILSRASTSSLDRDGDYEVIGS